MRVLRRANDGNFVVVLCECSKPSSTVEIMILRTFPVALSVKLLIVRSVSVVIEEDQSSSTL